MIWSVSGLSIFKHNSVAVVGLTADNCYTIIVTDIQIEIFLINFCDFFYSHDSFTVYNSHMKRLFQILINRTLSNLSNCLCCNQHNSQCSWNWRYSGNPFYSAGIYGKFCNLYGDRNCNSDDADTDRWKEKTDSRRQRNCF